MRLNHDGEVIGFRITYVPQIIENGSEPRPMTERETDLHQRWMKATGEERINLWKELSND